MKKGLLPRYNYGYLKHPFKYEKEHCQDCQREYTKDCMLQQKNGAEWRCIKCHNLAIKEAA